LPTTTRAKTATKPADEAQAEPVEGVVVDDNADKLREERKARTADMLEQVKTVIVERIRGENNPKFEALRAELDGLAETVAALGNGPGAVLEEDALNDRIDAAVERAANTVFGREVIGPDVKPLTEQLDDLRVALASHQADVQKVVNGMAQEFGAALEQVRVSRLEAASATGVMRDVVAEQRAAVPGVYRKVHALMCAVTEIGKNREFKAEGRGNSSGIEYSFRGIDDAMDAVGSALRTVGLIMRSEVVKAEHTVNEVGRFWQGKQEGVTLWATTRLTMRYTFIDPEDGTEHSVEGYGVGKDNGDKDGSKSSAAAMKYALFQGLCIPVKGMNIDPEEDHPTGEPTAAQRQARAEQEQHDDTPPPPDDTPPPDPDHALRRATGALAAARDPQKTRTQADLTAILAQAAKEKILSTEIEGQTLQAWLIGIRRTLGPTGGEE
jgi:hypothetical protein